MVTRIVKMTFRKGEEENFLAVFSKYKLRIRAAEGCTFLQLLRDVHSHHVFFTYSQWLDESCLHKYRDSEVFNELWPQAKRLFAKPPPARILRKGVCSARMDPMV